MIIGLACNSTDTDNTTILCVDAGSHSYKPYHLGVGVEEIHYKYTFTDDSKYLIPGSKNMALVMTNMTGVS